ncbi:rho guanine nucleotide exchange factor 7 isoform X6 [Hermetia illucens]|uniref:rho guanine nucleotide exchange factor 7 isoform X6 n=1 Tax=Hermetia illucens TaxID=343691 RepID=UPI0018CBF830|nr:rho guanine nucleotide exchange factor 7 isoform X6 [Hermetia illucens]
MIERVSQMCCTCRDVSMEQPYIVQAEYSFRGDNNDELCFKKGDIITVTQREEGGWWEGTLGDKTGWFPSNYVKEYKASLPLSETIRPPEEIQEYRSVVFKDLLESERAHVAEIRGLLENFLEPLGSSQLLTPDEYSQLMCNFVEVVETHEELLKGLEECNDRVGKLFLTKAPLMKSIHQAYCAAHPRAIVILDRYKVNLSTFLLLQLLHRNELESFMERQGAASPGLLVLTTGLSKPFRRLDKYSAMLQELERHMESSHPDRGDTQRSVAVYKDIAATCSATRRQKELELQVLTGPVRGWQGQELSTLGDIIHMGSVAVGPDHRDRYFVLFPQTLVILSVSQRMSAFIYEGKLPLTGIIVNRLEDTENYKNAFEISGQCIERIVAVCQGPNEANKWVELLSSINSSVPINIKRNISASAINTPQPPLHMSPPASLGHGTASLHQQQSQHKRSLSFNHHLSYNQYHNHQPQQLHQLRHQQHQQNQQQHQVGHKSNLAPISSLSKPAMGNHQGAVQSGKIGSTKANWSITNLRPAPPLRPNFINLSSAVGSSGALANYSSRKIQPTYEEDALVLRVIEAYCAAYQTNSRNTIHSALQPWTPCLPIRGGKLKTSKHFSTSNPQLPFLCSGTGSSSAAQPNSSSSLNSSYIWREASPNNFNMYSASVSSLNAAYRYSLGAGSGAGATGSIPNYYKTSTDYRSVSEERPPTNRKFYGNHSTSSNASPATTTTLKFKTGSNYDNICMTPLLPRKSLENEDMTPTLRQLWTSIKQLQQDMTQMKIQINEERALRGNLQQLLMNHLESVGTSNTTC